VVAWFFQLYLFFLLSEKKMEKTIDDRPPEKGRNTAVILLEAFRTAKIITDRCY
jgi:hypothetical protein